MGDFERIATRLGEMLSHLEDTAENLRNQQETRLLDLLGCNQLRESQARAANADRERAEQQIKLWQRELLDVAAYRQTLLEINRQGFRTVAEAIRGGLGDIALAMRTSR